MTNKICKECCNAYIQANQPEAVTIDNNGSCPNCNRYYIECDTNTAKN